MAARKPKAGSVDIRSAIVDEYGALCAELAAIAPKVDRKSKLEKEIASWFAATDPNESGEVSGMKFGALVSPCKLVRELDTAAIAKRLGPQAFAQYAKFPLSVFDAIVPAGEQGAYCASERSGSRSVKVFPKLAVAPKAAA
jgi:hypothetical protein